MSFLPVQPQGPTCRLPKAHNFQRNRTRPTWAEHLWGLMPTTGIKSKVLYTPVTCTELRKSKFKCQSCTMSQKKALDAICNNASYGFLHFLLSLWTVSLGQNIMKYVVISSVYGRPICHPTQPLRRHKTDSLWFASSRSPENSSCLLQWRSIFCRKYFINYTDTLTHFVFTLQGEGWLIHLRQREQSHSRERDKPVCTHSLNLIRNCIST